MSRQISIRLERLVFIYILNLTDQIQFPVLLVFEHIIIRRETSFSNIYIFFFFNKTVKPKRPIQCHWITYLLFDIIKITNDEKLNPKHQHFFQPIPMKKKMCNNVPYNLIHFFYFGNTHSYFVVNVNNIKHVPFLKIYETFRINIYFSNNGFLFLYNNMIFPDAFYVKMMYFHSFFMTIIDRKNHTADYLVVV